MKIGVDISSRKISNITARAIRKQKRMRLDSDGKIRVISSTVTRCAKNLISR